MIDPNLLFYWNGEPHKILVCRYATDRHIYVETAPHSPELIDEIKRRILADPHRWLGHCIGFGFACFPEDYQKYSQLLPAAVDLTEGVSSDTSLKGEV